MVTEKQLNEAKEVVAYYTLAATATGAIPVPAASEQRGQVFRHHINPAIIRS
jgi:hypothetical protein